MSFEKYSWRGCHPGLYKPAVIIDDDIISWSKFGAGTVLIADLPRNPNGKILKRELRKQYADALG